MRKRVSDGLEVAGLVAVTAGVAGLAGPWWAAIVGGLASVAYSVALTR